MPQVAERHETYLAAFEALRGRREFGPAWLATLREAAWRRFADTGFPTPRDEE